MVSFGPGGRTREPSGAETEAIQVPQRRLASYRRVLSAAWFVVHPAARCHPPRAAVQQLRNLHQDPQLAYRNCCKSTCRAVISNDAEEESPINRCHRDVLARGEDMLGSH